MPNCMLSTFPLCSKTCCWQGAALAASTDVSLEPSVLGDVSLGHDDENPTLWHIFATAQHHMPSACTETCPTLGHITWTFVSHLMGSPYTHHCPHRTAIAVEAFCSSNSLCWHTYLHAKHVPTTRAIPIKAFCSSNGLCWSEAHPCAPGLEDDGEEPAYVCPLLDAGRAMPGHPTPSLLSNLLQCHATLIASPTSAVERHAPAPPRPPGPT